MPGSQEPSPEAMENDAVRAFFRALDIPENDPDDWSLSNDEIRQGLRGVITALAAPRDAVLADIEDEALAAIEALPRYRYDPEKLDLVRDENAALLIACDVRGVLHNAVCRRTRALPPSPSSSCEPRATGPYSVVEWAEVYASTKGRNAAAMLMRGESILADFYDPEDARLACDALNAASCEPRAGGVEEERVSKDRAYTERNRLVAFLSRLYPSSLERHPASDASWEEDWRWIVFVDLPTGQATWHIHDSHLPLFAHLARETGRKWDGHTTDEKYDRLARLPSRDGGGAKGKEV